VPLPEKESEAFDHDHESQDENLIEEGSQVVSTVVDTVALRQQDCEFYDGVEAEEEDVDVQQHSKCHWIVHVFDLMLTVNLS
jgi:hypothetical protein